MSEKTLKLQKALKYNIEVMEKGRVEFNVPFLPGTCVRVIIMEESSDNLDDLLQSAQGSIGFWDNAYDDEDWNNA